MTYDDLQQLNDLKKEIDEMREKFTFIESTCPYGVDYSGKIHTGKLALCRVYNCGYDIRSSRKQQNDEIVVEFDEEIKMAVLQVLHSRLSILENKFNNLNINKEG